jgi:hypothetical protein
MVDTRSTLLGRLSFKQSLERNDSRLAHLESRHEKLLLKDLVGLDEFTVDSNQKALTQKTRLSRRSTLCREDCRYVREECWSKQNVESFYTKPHYSTIRPITLVLLNPLLGR